MTDGSPDKSVFVYHPSLGSIACAGCSTTGKGRYTYNQDEFDIQKDFLTELPGSLYFAIFDGHGSVPFTSRYSGGAIAVFVKETLRKHVISELHRALFYHPRRRSRSHSMICLSKTGEPSQFQFPQEQASIQKFGERPNNIPDGKASNKKYQNFKEDKEGLELLLKAMHESDRGVERQALIDIQRLIDGEYSRSHPNVMTHSLTMDEKKQITRKMEGLSLETSVESPRVILHDSVFSPKNSEASSITGIQPSPSDSVSTITTTTTTNILSSPSSIATSASTATSSTMSSTVSMSSIFSSTSATTVGITSPRTLSSPASPTTLTIPSASSNLRQSTVSCTSSLTPSQSPFNPAKAALSPSFASLARDYHSPSSLFCGTQGRVCRLNQRGSIAAISDALKRAFRQTNKALNNYLHSTGLAVHPSGGTTGVVCVILWDLLFVANIGDSFAVVGGYTESGVSTVSLTRRHHWCWKDERDRIIDAGGRFLHFPQSGVTYLVDREKKCTLSMSRALGDREYEDVGMETEAEVDVHFLRRWRDFVVILGTDGVGDVLNPDECVAEVSEVYYSFLEEAERIEEKRKAQEEAEEKKHEERKRRELLQVMSQEKFHRRRKSDVIKDKLGDGHQTPLFMSLQQQNADEAKIAEEDSKTGNELPQNIRQKNSQANGAKSSQMPVQSLSPDTFMQIHPSTTAAAPFFSTSIAPSLSASFTSPATPATPITLSLDNSSQISASSSSDASLPSPRPQIDPNSSLASIALTGAHSIIAAATNRWVQTGQMAQMDNMTAVVLFLHHIPLLPPSQVFTPGCLISGSELMGSDSASDSSTENDSSNAT